MTIGPEPMRRIERMSVRRGIEPLSTLNRLDESPEQIPRVVWAGRRLRMILHGKGGLPLHGETLDGLVVQIEMRHLGAAAERLRVDGEAVVLRRDLDLAGGEVLDRLVPPVVPELELERPPAEREAHDLVAEADAEHWHLAEELGDDLAHAGDGVGVARPVREEDAVGAEGEDVAGGRGRGDDADAAAGADQVAQDVELDAEVVGDDDVWRAAVLGGSLLRRRVAAAEPPRPLAPVVRRRARHFLHEVASDETGRLLRLAHEAPRIEIDARQHRLLRAHVAEVAP